MTSFERKQLRGQTKNLNCRAQLKKKIKLTNEYKKKQRIPMSNKLNDDEWDFFKIIKKWLKLTRPILQNLWHGSWCRITTWKSNPKKIM